VRGVLHVKSSKSVDMFRGYSMAAEAFKVVEEDEAR
jgi:hypothetical protein